MCHSGGLMIVQGEVRFEWSDNAQIQSRCYESWRCLEPNRWHRMRVGLLHFAPKQHSGGKRQDDAIDVPCNAIKVLIKRKGEQSSGRIVNWRYAVEVCRSTFKTMSTRYSNNKAMTHFAARDTRFGPMKLALIKQSCDTADSCVSAIWLNVYQNAKVYVKNRHLECWRYLQLSNNFAYIIFSTWIITLFIWFNSTKI